MRKIRVSGCVNCPYEAGEKCEHPSFVEKDRAIDIPEQYLKAGEGALPMSGYVPDWCPLDVEPFYGYCNPCPTC